MTLKLYNTRTRKKEVFEPLDLSNVRMYVCGPTVYDYAHIGNARPIIVFDVLYRLLQHIYGPDHVTYARNITDVDDKINARAAEQYPDLPLNEAIRKVTEETTAQFHKDVAALGCLEPTHEPRATDYIEQMKDMITQLYEADIAYVAEDHVLFSVAAYGKLKNVPAYGSLARRSLDEMVAGARVEVAPYKRDAMDFVLWKPSKGGEPGWPSPLNINALGRPGWHLECSAMSKAILGDEFDIHGGGIDLVFPHHENEVAQSCAANRTAKMANVWMHNGFLQVEGQKMSKSLGNFLTIHELRTGWLGYGWPGEAIKFNMLQTHYRQPIDWTLEGLDASHKTLDKWYRKLEVVEPSSEAPETFVDCLLDDLNIPGAIAELHKLSNGERYKDLRAALNLIGFSGQQERLMRKRELSQQADRTPSLEAEAQVGPPQVETEINIFLSKKQKEAIQEFINQRLAARKAKNWAEADRIRDELAEQGIALKDSKDPETGEIVTTWEIAR